MQTPIFKKKAYLVPNSRNETESEEEATKDDLC